MLRMLYSLSAQIAWNFSYLVLVLRCSLCCWLVCSTQKSAAPANRFYHSTCPALTWWSRVCFSTPRQSLRICEGVVSGFPYNDSLLGRQWRGKTQTERSLKKSLPFLTLDKSGTDRKTDLAWGTWECDIRIENNPGIRNPVATQTSMRHASPAGILTHLPGATKCFWVSSGKLYAVNTTVWVIRNDHK